MTINTDLLIAAPMLQDYLVDKDTGFPLANGQVSLYIDNQRSFFKNWYYQTGAPGAYTWIPLDNPLNLSSVGTIQDPNGNDVIPFYYPFDETNQNVAQPYYITVYSVDSNGNPAVLQFTRENFPFQPSNFSPTVQNPTWRNYILNNVYWRNIGALNCTNVTAQVIAPSQHEGYTNGDIQFLKSTTGATDNLAFLPMTEVLDDDITPEYYLNMECSGTQAGETVKCIQYPISLHVATLSNVPATVVFQGQNVAGSTNNYVDLYIYQYLGTGALSQPAPILIQRVVLGNTFQKFSIPFIFPDASGLTLGLGGDDALFLRVQYPLSALFEVNHTKPQIYLSTDVPDNDFDTYDQIESIINSPRTGDYKTSLNSFQPFGYVIVNDGNIGDAASSATTRANIDTWPLYNMLWSGVNDTFAPVSTGRGANAYADFTANKTIGLPKALGRVLQGLPTSSTFTYDHTTSLLTVTDATLYYPGSPVILTNTGGALPAAFSGGVVYYVIPVSGTTFKLASTYANALAGTAVAAGADNGSGTNTVSFALGGSYGQASHIQLVAELASHNHTFGSGAQSVFGTSGGSAGTSTGTDFHAFANTDSTGSSAPFNVIQPSTYGYVFLKL